ncbi:MAG: Na/Pi cotransporter family protein [Firmicutes bacterium]|nr:Na/Pi cotransporter family protein [Bacillota bacterium]
MSWFVAIGMFGGLGLFLFGIQMMASGMQKMAGDRLRHILEIFTGKPIVGVFTGLIVTVLLQSSSTTTVMLVGFVNAGLMNLSQALGVIMGANIGTTITAQIISFKLEYLALPFIGIGGLFNFFGRRRLYRYLGQTILGFGLLFLGMVTMSEAMHPLRENPFFIDLLLRFGERPLLGILISALFTAVIQSSSAVTGIIIALSLQGLISLQSAIPLILGSNIGTCITAVLASIGASLPARKTAYAHVLFNTIGVILMLIFLKPFTFLVLESADTVARQAANAHTLFNVLNTIVLFPFFKYFIRLVNIVVPGEESAVNLGSKYLDRRMLKAPAVAINSSKQELLRMANMAREVVADSIDAFCRGSWKKIPHILQAEDLIDGLEKEINVYLQELSQHSLTRQQTTSVSGIMSAANDLERIADHGCNIAHLAELVADGKFQITPKAREEVFSLFEKVDDMLGKAIEALADENVHLAREVIQKDDIVDELERILRKNHIDRVNRKECVPAVGVIYLDVLSNLERIADHCVNLGQVVSGDFY